MDFNPSYQNASEEAKNSKKPGLFQRLKESFTAPALRKSKKTVTKLATFFAVQMSALTGVSAAYAEDHHANAPVKSETKTEQTVATEKTENTEVEKTEESAPTPEVTPAPTASEEEKTEQNTSEAETSSEKETPTVSPTSAPTTPEVTVSAAPVSSSEQSEEKKETTETSPITVLNTQEAPSTEASATPVTTETSGEQPALETTVVPEVTPRPSASEVPVKEGTEKQSTPLLDKKEIQGVEHDEILVDEFHTRIGGMTFIDGKPVLAFPITHPESEKKYFMYLPSIDGGYSENVPLLTGVNMALESNDVPMIGTTTRAFLNNIDKLLKADKLTDREKRRIHFALAYMYGYMNAWKYADSTNTQRIADDEIITPEGREEGFQKAWKALKALDDGSAESRRLIEEVEIFNIKMDFNGTRWFVAGERTSKRDTQRAFERMNYVSSAVRVAEYLSSKTQEYLSGTISASDLVSVLHITKPVLDSAVAIQKTLPARGWYTNDNDASRIGRHDLKDQSLFASQALIRGMSTAVTALGTQGSVQQLREVPAVSQQLLELAKLVSTDTYTITEVAGMPKISQPLSAVEIMQITQTLGANAEAVLAKYSPERLALAADTPERLASLRMDFNSTVARYANIQNDSTIGTRLKGLLDKVEGAPQNGRWSPEDKTALYALYKEAYGATTQQAQDQLFATLKTYAIVEDKKAAVKTIKPFSETGMRVNFGFSDYLVEDENGNEVSTTEHPVLTYQEKRVLYSKLPYDIYVTVTFDLEGTGLITDNPRQSFNVKIPAGKYADVIYTAHISTVREKQPRVEPRMEVQIAQNGLAVPNMNASADETMLIAAGLAAAVPPVATNQTSEKKEEEKK